MFKFLHFMHDESKANWIFEKLEETQDSYEATWMVVCKCGKVTFRTRAYMKPNKASIEYLTLVHKEGQVQKYIDNGTYHTFFGHTYESALLEAKQYKGDNYHI